MDLLQTVRKEGSRGGRADFSWSDVSASTHRENYLGHSVKAPVGRWQRGRDLSWYAKGDDDSGKSEEELRKEELRLVKEREEDEMRKALGLPAIERGNANLEPLGEGMGIGFEGAVEEGGRERSRSPERKRKDERRRSRDREWRSSRDRERRRGERDARDRRRHEDRERRATDDKRSRRVDDSDRHRSDRRRAEVDAERRRSPRRRSYSRSRSRSRTRRHRHRSRSPDAERRRSHR